MSVNFPGLPFNVASNYPINIGPATPAIKPAATPKIETIQRGQFDGLKTLTPVTSTIVVTQPIVYPLKYIDKYFNKDVIENAIETNPEIRKILNDNGIEAIYRESNVNQAFKKHLFSTYLNATGIANRLRLDRDTTNKIGQAALLHDIGKSLIPESLIQKPGRLTPEERQIVHLHSSLGAEILKTTDLSPDVIEAVEMHHSLNESDNKTANVIANVISVADVYSALKEQRSYKTTMTDENAFKIMRDMPKLPKNYVNALSQQRYMAKLFI